MGASDKLSGIEGKSPFSKGNQAAARYGFARIGISTPNHNWEFGNNNIINDDKPMPCSDDDSEDIAYVRKIIEFLESHPEQFDASGCGLKDSLRTPCFQLTLVS